MPPSTHTHSRMEFHSGIEFHSGMDRWLSLDTGGPSPYATVAGTPGRRPRVYFRFTRRPVLSLLSGIFCSKTTLCHTALAPHAIIPHYCLKCVHTCCGHTLVQVNPVWGTLTPFGSSQYIVLLRTRGQTGPATPAMAWRSGPWRATKSLQSKWKLA